MRVGLVLLLMLAACKPIPAHAAPPPVGSEDWEVMAPHGAWFKDLKLPSGASCCDVADGRPVEARSVGDRWQIRFRPGQLDGAPAAWVDVPEDAVLRVANPVGMPIAFWLGGVVRCFVPGVMR